MEQQNIMNKPKTALITNVRDDHNWFQNKNRLESQLAVGSEVTAYQLMEKAEHEKFDNQSCWLDIYYTHNGQEFKTRWSYKANQYIRVLA